MDSNKTLIYIKPKQILKKVIHVYDECLRQYVFFRFPNLLNLLDLNKIIKYLNCKIVTDNIFKKRKENCITLDYYSSKTFMFSEKTIIVV